VDNSWVNALTKSFTGDQKEERKEGRDIRLWNRQIIEVVKNILLKK